MLKRSREIEHIHLDGKRVDVPDPSQQPRPKKKGNKGNKGKGKGNKGKAKKSPKTVIKKEKARRRGSGINTWTLFCAEYFE